MSGTEFFQTPYYDPYMDSPIFQHFGSLPQAYQQSSADIYSRPLPSSSSPPPLSNNNANQNDPYVVKFEQDPVLDQYLTQYSDANELQARKMNDNNLKTIDETVTIDKCKIIASNNIELQECNKWLKMFLIIVIVFLLVAIIITVYVAMFSSKKPVIVDSGSYYSRPLGYERGNYLL